MKVLLVEDDDKKREHIVAYLQQALPGADIVEKRSYQSGLKEIVTGEADLIVLDMSMPTYDRSPEESGLRPKPFAGKEILGQMERRGIATPVVIVTQFESFGEGHQTRSLRELKNELAEMHATNYLGTVYYNPMQNNWTAEIGEILRARGLGRVRRR